MGHHGMFKVLTPACKVDFIFVRQSNRAQGLGNSREYCFTKSCSRQSYPRHPRESEPGLPSYVPFAVHESEAKPCTMTNLHELPLC